MDTKHFFNPSSRRSTSNDNVESAITNVGKQIVHHPKPHFDKRSTQTTENNTSNSRRNSSRGVTPDNTFGTTGSWSRQRLQTKPPPLEEQAASAAQQLLEELQNVRLLASTSTATNTNGPTSLQLMPTVTAPAPTTTTTDAAVAPAKQQHKQRFEQRFEQHFERASGF